MKYPLTMRIIHWVMAVIILGMIWSGWIMVPESYDEPYEPGPWDFLYFWHKSFGILLIILFAARLFMRSRATLPELPSGFASWEVKAAKAGHAALYTLMIVVPLMGYAMSTVFTESDGVTLFGIPVPSLLPKNDDWFPVFQWLHKWLAYTLLALIVVHILGALKHRFLDRNRDNDVLSRMI